MGIQDKLDKIVADIGEIKVTTALNTSHLGEHMKRTDLLETRVEQVASAMKPIQSHVDMVSGALKLLGIIGTIIGIIAGVMKLW